MYLSLKKKEKSFFRVKLGRPSLAISSLKEKDFYWSLFVLVNKLGCAVVKKHTQTWKSQWLQTQMFIPYWLRLPEVSACRDYSVVVQPASQALPERWCFSGGFAQLAVKCSGQKWMEALQLEVIDQPILDTGVLSTTRGPRKVC